MSDLDLMTKLEVDGRFLLVSVGGEDAVCISDLNSRTFHSVNICNRKVTKKTERRLMSVDVAPLYHENLGTMC